MVVGAGRQQLHSGPAEKPGWPGSRRRRCRAAVPGRARPGAYDSTSSVPVSWLLGEAHWPPAIQALVIACGESAHGCCESCQCSDDCVQQMSLGRHRLLRLARLPAACGIRSAGPIVARCVTSCMMCFAAGVQRDGPGSADASRSPGGGGRRGRRRTAAAAHHAEGGAGQQPCADQAAARAAGGWRVRLGVGDPRGWVPARLQQEHSFPAGIVVAGILGHSMGYNTIQECL